MQIDLTEVFARENQVLTYECSLETNELVYAKERFSVKEKKPFTLSISCAVKRKITISGNTEIIVLIPCDRCLMDVPEKLALDIHREIDFEHLSDNPEEALEVSSFIEENMLDVDAFIANELFLVWPSKTLCSASCKGICKKCGKNLNDGDCGCEQTELDPRMAAIRDIFYANYKEEV